MRRCSQMCFDKPIKVEQWLLVEDHGVQISGQDTGVLQTEPNSRLWKGGIVLYSAEPLLLGSSRDLAVHDERRSAVVIER